MPLLCAEYSAFIPAASHASKRCCFRRLRYIFSYSCTLSSKCSAARQPFRFLRPAFVIDRGRCRSVRGILCIHSGGFSRKQAMLLLPFALHISCICTLSSNYSAARQVFRFLRPAFAIDRVGCRFRVRKCAAFIQAASHASK